MRNRTAWVAVFYIVASMIVAAVFDHALSDLFQYFRINNFAVLGDRFTLSSLVGLLLAVSIAVYVALLNANAHRFIDECFIELDKVAWPTAKETRNATAVVVVMSTISAVILGMFDAVFGWLSKHDLFLR